MQAKIKQNKNKAVNGWHCGFPGQDYCCYLAADV
jgi:hypothetical protein